MVQIWMTITFAEVWSDGVLDIEAWWILVDCGGTWRNMVKCGGTWWSVLDRCGQCMELWRPLKSKYSLCTYVDKFIVYFFSYGCCLLENGINPSESIRGKTFNKPITTVQLWQYTNLEDRYYCLIRYFIDSYGIFIKKSHLQWVAG